MKKNMVCKMYSAPRSRFSVELPFKSFRVCLSQICTSRNWNFCPFLFAKELKLVRSVVCEWQVFNRFSFKVPCVWLHPLSHQLPPSTLLLKRSPPKSDAATTVLDSRGGVFTPPLLVKSFHNLIIG